MTTTTRAVTRLVPESARTEGEVLVELVPEELERGAIAVAASATDDDLLDVPGFDDVVFGIAVEAGVETFNFGECFHEIAVLDAAEGPVFELPLGAVDENRHDAFPIFAYFGHLVRDFVLHGLVSFIRSK